MADIGSHGRNQDQASGSAMPTDSGRGPLASWTVADLFDRLDVVHELLRDNADRWFLRGTNVGLLTERDSLHHEGEAIEQELQRRTPSNGKCVLDPPVHPARPRTRPRKRSRRASTSRDGDPLPRPPVP